MSRLALRSPVIIIAIAASAAVSAGMILWLSGATPWLGTPLIPVGDKVTIERLALGVEGGAVVESIAAPGKAPIPLVASDLVAEPDSLPTYRDLQAFYDRQDQLFALLQAPAVELKLRTSTGEALSRTITPHPRPLWTLPMSFWIQVLTGVISVLISGWVWALRPGHLPPTLFAISGLGVLLVTLTSAFYAHRGLALPSDAYAVLIPLNHLGVFFFAGGMIGLFLIYPRQLLRPRWLWLIPLIFAPYALVDTLHLGPDMSIYGLVVLGLTLAILSLIAAQWWATRRFPDERAVLGWLGLSVAFAVSIFSFLSLAPGLLGLNSPLSQHYAAGAIVIIYVGLALGLRRYRLFEMGVWSYRILFYTLGAFLLLALDAALIAGLNLDLAPALAVSLLLVGLAYLPLRDWLWQRLFLRQHVQQHELFSAAMDIAFAPRKTDSALRWRQLLARLFDPLETAEGSPDLAEPAIAEDGLVLNLPPVAGAPALRLRYPFGGTGLFQPAHLSLAANLVRLTERAEESRQAYMRGVGEERRRMARDLHDDVGARLVTGLHTADERTRPTLQAALSDIRAIVSGLAGDEADLDLVLAQMRHEAARRLEAAGIAFDWPLIETAPTRLDYRVHKALTSALREIVSNVVRHSGATRLAVTPTLDAERLTLRVHDNGTGVPPAVLTGESAGFGLKNLRHRIEELGGTVSIVGLGGTTMVLDIPLVLGVHPPEPGVSFTTPPLESGT